ncbi:MAG TPA: hypothetical protein PK915_12885 [Bacteroidales bacterium]|nr:hypothetical protein [Bacteroidales bacterium]
MQKKWPLFFISNTTDSIASSDAIGNASRNTIGKTSSDAIGNASRNAIGKMLLYFVASSDVIGNPDYLNLSKPKKIYL